MKKNWLGPAHRLCTARGFSKQPPRIPPSLELNNLFSAHHQVLESSLAPPLGAGLPSHNLSGDPAVARQTIVFPSLEGGAVISVSSDQQSAQDIYFLEFIENLENRVRESNWSSLRIWKLEFITGRRMCWTLRIHMNSELSEQS